WPCDPKSFERSGVLPPGKRPRLGIQGVVPGEASAEHGGMAWIRLPATPPTGATSRRRPTRGGLPNTTAYGRGWLLETLEKFAVRALCIEVAHGFLPCHRRVFIRHRQHPLDQVGDGPGVPSLFFGRDGEDVACGVVAGHRTRR